MKNTLIKLGAVSLPLKKYSSQGNAVLGIRGSGKSYTSTNVAEQLMDASIPIVAFDPIGVWRYLKVPGVGKGYPVVVAHPDNGDLPLTPESAPEIVRAAMKNNVSLVIDLYSIKLSKAAWRQIVENCTRVLLHENGEYGLRHIFIEEAAEFIPQRVTPEYGKVYAEMEKLARMGGNARLGYTLINQRAEEVSKAVLELCDCLLLHRQRGRNSLTALEKWLEYGVTDTSSIMDTIPTLQAGHCWVWQTSEARPQLAEVQAKNSFHPDRESDAAIKIGKATDVSEFVTSLRTSLEEFIEKSKAEDPATLKAEITQLKKELAKAGKAVNTVTVEVPVFDDKQMALISRVLEVTANINITSATLVTETQEMNKLLLTLRDDVMKRITVTTGKVTPYVPPTRIKVVPAKPQGPIIGQDTYLSKCERAILTVLAQYPDGKEQNALGILSGYSPNSGNFSNNLSSLRNKGYINRTWPAQVTEDGLNALGNFEPLPQGEELRAYWLNKADLCPRKILAALFENPEGLTKEQIGSITGYSHESGNFSNGLSYLRTLELITRTNPIKYADVFNL